MENLVTRVVEIEKQCALEVERAERESQETIEANKRSLEEKKAKEIALIIAADKERLGKAIEAAKKKSEEAFQAASRLHEAMSQDSALNKELKEKVISILLEIGGK